MKLLLPVLLALVGLSGGLAAGHFLKPAAEPEAAAAAGAGAEGVAAPAPVVVAATPEPVPAEALPGASMPPYDPTVRRDYVKIDQQFLVPIVEAEVVSAMMILSLSLELEPGLRDAVPPREPKLRDRFLQVMFRHAQGGGFSGVFTAGAPMRDLRGSLLEAARSVLGPGVHDVLVTDLLRQDL